MFSSSSSLSFTWTDLARPVSMISLEEQFLRIITDCFGVEREAMQVTRHEVDQNSDNSQAWGSEVLFTFPGGFLHVTCSHLLLRVTNHVISSGSTCSPLTSSFINQIAQMFSFSVEDDQNQQQRGCSINDVASALVYVSFAVALDTDMYTYLSSAFMDGQWFANSVLPSCFPFGRPLTVSGFVFGGFPGTAAASPFRQSLSLSEALMFFPSSMDSDSVRIGLISTPAGQFETAVKPALPFNSDSGQLFCQRAKKGQPAHFQLTFVEGSFPCDSSSGHQFLRLSSATCASKQQQVPCTVEAVLQNYQQSRIPECVLVEIIATGSEATTITTNQSSDPFAVKNILLHGFGYKICLRHLKHAEATKPTQSLSVPSATTVPNNIPLKRRLVPRTSSKQALTNLMNQLQSKRSRSTVMSSSSTMSISEIQVVHVAKSSQGVVVLGLPSAYQDEADVLRRYISHFKPDRAVMLVNIQKVVEQWQRWKANLPRVQPYYAVKCNTDLGILQTLANLGSNFDCASQREVDVIVKTLQLSPDRIVYSNPCKQDYGIRHAKQRKVKLTVFDNLDELIKTARIYPECELLLRISTDDGGSQCPLSCKFGASSNSWFALLYKAKELKLNVRGVHFHVGSGCSQLGVFSKALKDARLVFDLGIALGFKMEIVNIGGGFPGVLQDDPVLITTTNNDDDDADNNNNNNNRKAVVTFEDLCNEINPMLNLLFPSCKGYKVMAEPGRYFAAPSSCLAVKIYSRRKPISDNNDSSAKDGRAAGTSASNCLYYINDGVYGSFNNLVFDHAEVVPRILIQSSALRRQQQEEKSCNDSSPSPMIESTIFGQTCDGFDCVKRGIQLPQLEIGDWLMFESMGAYTVCAASTFNGFELPTKLHVRIMPGTKTTLMNNNNNNSPVVDVGSHSSVSSACCYSQSPSLVTSVVSWNSSIQQLQQQQQSSLSPCLAGYQLYQQQQQQHLLQQHQSSSSDSSDFFLPVLPLDVIPNIRRCSTSTTTTSPVIDSNAIAPLPSCFPTDGFFDHQLPAVNETDSMMLIRVPICQRPRSSFRPVSVRPLQSTAQQHTSYPRLGGSKVNPRLVATLLRSAYCRHRPISPASAASSSSSLVVVASSGSAAAASVVAAVATTTATTTIHSSSPSPIVCEGLSSHSVPSTTECLVSLSGVPTAC